MARPLKDIDPKDVEKLASMFASNVEIAHFLDCSVDTLTRRFAEELNKGRSLGRIALRKLQWASAQKGNVVMQIWLGKQILGQVDKHEITQDVKLETSDAERKARIEKIKAMARDGK